MISVPNLTILNNLVNKEENELAMTEDGKVYRYTNNQWEEYAPESGELNFSLYEINK